MPIGPEAQGTIEEPRWVVLEEFLVWRELGFLVDYIGSREVDFTTSHVIGAHDPAYSDHRRSRVLLDLGPFRAVICRRIEQYLPRVLDKLGLRPFDISRIETQVTASNDGDYFRAHRDITEPDSWTGVTFVYFCHREPKAFTGGELVLHDMGSGDTSSVSLDPPRALSPEQNAIVFFPSRCLHEIRPVRCPTKRFADSRFTLNGWIHGC